MTTESPDPSQPQTGRPAGEQPPGGGSVREPGPPPGGTPGGQPAQTRPGAAQQPIPAPAQASFEPWGRRAGAALIDGLIVGVAYYILSFIFTGLIVGSAASGLTTGGDLAGAFLLSLIVNIIIVVVVIMAYAGYTMTRPGPFNGQTVGKQLIGIRVVRLDGQAVTLDRVALRELAIKVLAPTILTFTGIGLIIAIPYVIVDNLFPLWDSRQQALHDKAASTLVVPA